MNAICPGWVATAKVRAYLATLGAEARREAAPARLIAPEEFADLVVMLWERPELAGRVIVWEDGQPWRMRPSA